jgi:hypothetical protein
MTATKTERALIRAISVNGEMFVPGQEDEMEAALQAHEDAQDKDGKFNVKDELKRLETMGSIAGFADVAEEDYIESDADRRATKEKNGHLLQDKRPLQPSGPPAPTMEDVQRTADDNVVAEKMAGGKKEPEADKAKLAKATKEANEELEESQVQQESEQVEAPAKATKAKAKGKAKR